MARVAHEWCDTSAMPTPSRYTERLAVMLSPDQRAWLDAEADRRGVSAAQVVREAVDAARRVAR